MTVRKDKFPFLAFREPWATNPNNIWLASTLNLYRNLARYHFPTRLDTEGQKRILDLLCKSLSVSNLLEDPIFVSAETTGPLEREFLHEHFLTPRSFQAAMEGEGFLTDKTGQIFAIFNIRDHLQLQLINCRDHLESAWRRLYEIESAVGRSLEFAYNARFGFLTADPHLCGTGFVVQLFLHIPALVHTETLGDLLETFKQEDVEIQGVDGKLDHLVGDLITIRNRSTIGLTEENMLQTLQTCALKVMIKEKSARNILRREGDAELKNRISRAYALLTHSYQQETAETWGAISLLKLGLDLGWVEGIDHSQLNELFFSSQRAHLVADSQEEIPQKDIAHKRAEYLHTRLGDAKLNI